MSEPRNNAPSVQRRPPARPAEQRSGGPDNKIRCMFCDQGVLPGEVFETPRQCCKAGFLADAEWIAKERWP